MARRIEHRSTSEWPAARVHEALIDEDYLRARLRELGGTHTELVEHRTTEDGVHFEIHQAVRAESLPSVVRTVVGGDLLIDRSESWRREEEGHYTGEVAAAIPGVPGWISGSMWLRDLPEPEADNQVSELVVDGTVRVNVPFLGGRVEDLVVDQIQKLLSDEDRFTSEWLSRDR